MTNIISLADPIPLVTTQLTGRRVRMCGMQPPNFVPTTVPIVLNWTTYRNSGGTAAPKGPVAINIETGVSNPISEIRSIKIDNLGCSSACTIIFPDTGDEVICPPDSTVYSNVLTGQLNAFAIMPINTANLGTRTTVFFNNFHLDPATLQNTVTVENLELATGAANSLNFTRVPSIGDQLNEYTLNLALTGVGSQVQIFGSNSGYNFDQVKELHFSTVANYSDGAAPIAMNASIVDDTGATFFTFKWMALNGLADYSYKRVRDIVNAQKILSGQIALATTRNYFLQNNVAAVGSGLLEIVYTKVNVVNF